MLLAILVAASAAADPLTIEHSPLSCVPVDRYAQVVARATPPASSAALQFRTGAGGAWYSVRMRAEDGQWVGSLPRPTAALRGLEYRIVMTDRDAATAATPAAAVRVAAECDPEPPSSVEASLVVTVPPGAPLVPPVPAGFSPAGVVAAEEPRRLGRGMKIAGAVAGAAVLGATAAGVAGSSPEEVPEVPGEPQFRFNNVFPPPGSVLSPSRDPLTIEMRVTGGPPGLQSLEWRAEVRSEATGRTCLTMLGRFSVVGPPVAVMLTAPLVATGAGGCGLQFETDSIRITITRNAEPIHEETIGVPFRFVP